MIRRKIKKTKYIIYAIVAACIIEAVIIVSLLLNSIKKPGLSGTYPNFSQIESTINEYKNINEDYVCQLIFDFGSIDTPVFQAKSIIDKSGSPYKIIDKDGNDVTGNNNYNANDVYKWIDYETMTYDPKKSGGSVYMDFRNNMNSQNIIIYGHDFKSNSGMSNRKSKGLTAFEALLTEQSENTNVILVSDNEIREYELWAVYNHDTTNPTYENNYRYDNINNAPNNSSGNDYFNFINSMKLYYAGVSLSNSDQVLTLVLLPVPESEQIQVCIYRLCYKTTFTKR